MAPATSIKLVFSSALRLVDAVDAATERVAKIAGFDEDDALNLSVAVREAVVNAIVHGNRLDPARKVEVVLRAGARSVSARVRDQGVGFDVAATPDPTVGDNRMRTSGRGLLVMRSFVDEVSFKFREGRGMEVILTKTRSRGKETSSARTAEAAMHNGGIER